MSVRLYRRAYEDAQSGAWSRCVKRRGLCILTSDNPDNESPSAIISEIATYFTAGTCPYVAIPDRRKAIEYALKNAKKGDIILLAGKGHETYQLVCGVREYFSEAEIVKEFCDKHSEG